MQLVSIRAWLLVILAAILQVAIFPLAGPVPAWRAALSWIALVPIFLALTTPGRTGQPLRLPRAAVLGYLCGVLWYAGNASWIYQTMYLYGGLPKPVAFLILVLFSLYLGLYHALFATLFVLARRSFSNASAAFILAPFLWVAVELARARITGFPWDLLGNTQIDNAILIRIAPLTGVMGISFLIAAINAALALVLVSGTKRSRLAITSALVLVLATRLLNPVLFDSEMPNPYLPVAVMMQENLQVGAVAKQEQPLSPSQEMDVFSASSLAAKHGVSGDWFGAVSHRPAIIIWPEAPSHLRSDDPTFRASMAHLAATAHAPLIIGSLGVDQDTSSPRGYYLYDSASLFDAAGSYQGRYDKIHLVPWGEYIPFKRFFAFAQKLTEGVGDMDPGHARTVFTTGGHTYGVFVCYESIFGDEVRHFAQGEGQPGAEVLVQISDDGWYGDTGAPWQHLNMARMRAIENHRWLLRATNTGITTAIDPQGRMAAQAPRHVRAAFAFPFAFLHGTTFYTRHGDWFAWLCVLITFAALAFGLRSRLPYN